MREMMGAAHGGLNAGLEQQPQVEEEGTPASPEEQALYDETVSRAFLTIFDEKTRKPRPSVLKMLGDAADPEEALAETTAAIMAKVTGAAAESGVKIPTDVKVSATSEVFSTLAELASKQGKRNFMKDDTAFDAAFLRAINKLQLQEQEMGTLDPAEMESEFGAMVQAERDGMMGAA